MKRDENKLITLVIDQSKMTKEQDKAWWGLIQQGWVDETVLYMGRGNCTIDDESEVQDD